MADLITDYFNPKCENLSYTIGVIKPNTSMKQENIQNIINKIEEEGFIIKNMIQRQLIKEEILNLFYKHHKKEYHDDIVEYMLSGECCVILMCHETENPIKKWKEIIGHKDPARAKTDAPECLRAVYGEDIIKNELHGSDNAIEANKERDIFKFAIPQKIPEFVFDKMKVSLSTLFKFIFPPNLEHPDVNERLDIFAQYGPAVNYHSVDQCLCYPCARIGKEVLEVVRQKKLISEKTRLGISTKNDANLKKFAASMSTRKGTTQKGEKVKIAPIRLLKEEDIQSIYEQLCEKCKDHVDNFAHLTGGRDGQVVLTDPEINGLAQEINKNELLDLLIIEKGNAAKIMIEKIKIKEPQEIQYSRDILKVLFSDIETDYYERYNFYDMQQTILEDRRIRFNYWMAKLINKPIERFGNPKLIDPTLTQEERKNIKSVNFTLERTLPLTQTVKKKNISHVTTDMPPSIIDKSRLQDNEQRIALQSKIHRNTTHIMSIDDVGKQKVEASLGISVNLMRKGYNPGRNGAWNNYSSLKGQQKGTYVKTRNTPYTSEFK